MKNNGLLNVISQAVGDDIRVKWFDLMCHQGSQTSRRIAQRCLKSEQRSLDILMDQWLKGVPK